MQGTTATISKKYKFKIKMDFNDFKNKKKEEVFNYLRMDRSIKKNKRLKTAYSDTF